MRFAVLGLLAVASASGFEARPKNNPHIPLFQQMEVDRKPLMVIQRCESPPVEAYLNLGEVYLKLSLVSTWTGKCRGLSQNRGTVENGDLSLGSLRPQVVCPQQKTQLPT